MSTTTQILFNSPALHSLKRDQLVKLCKIHSIKASGKNVDLIEKLKHHAQTLPKDSPLSIASRSEPPSNGMQVDEEDSDSMQEDEQEDKENQRFQMPRPSEQWEVVMESIEEMEESASQGTLTGKSGEFGTGNSKFSSSIRTLASSFGIKRSTSEKSALSTTNSNSRLPGPASATSRPAIVDELTRYAAPYSSLPETDPSNAPQTDHFSFDPTPTMLKKFDFNNTEESTPLPGHVLRPGLPAPANARLSMGLAPVTPSGKNKKGPTTTIRLISNPFAFPSPDNVTAAATTSGQPSTPQLKPFHTTFDLVLGTPTKGGSSWPPNSNADDQIGSIYPALPLEHTSTPSSALPIAAPATPTAHSLPVPESGPFIFGSPNPKHRVSDIQFRSAAASVLEEMNRRLEGQGVEGVGTNIIENLKPGSGKQSDGRVIKPLRKSAVGSGGLGVKDKFDKAHEKEFSKMEGIGGFLARKNGINGSTSSKKQVNANEDNSQVGTKRKSNVLGDDSGKPRRPTGSAVHKNAAETRVISNGRRKGGKIPGAFGDDDDDSEEEQDGGGERGGKKARVEFDHQGVDDARDPKELEQDAERIAKEREAIRKRLEINKARRRSSVANGGRASMGRGRVSTGRNGVLQKSKKPDSKPSRFGFFSSAAKSIVKGVWGSKAKAAPNPVPVTKPSTSAAAKPTVSAISANVPNKKPADEGTMGPPPLPRVERKKVSSIPAPSNSVVGKSTTTSLRPPSMRGTITSLSSTSSSSRARSPIPSFGSNSRTSSLRTSGTGTASTRNSSITSRNAGSMGMRTSSASSSAASSLGARSSLNPSVGAKRKISTSSRLLAPTASSLAKTGSSVHRQSSAGLGSLSSVNHPKSPLIAVASTEVPMLGTPSKTIFSKPLVVPLGSGIPSPVRSTNPGTTRSSHETSSGDMDKPAVGFTRQRTLTGRKPRISRSKVIAKLASQRAASGSASASASTASATGGKIRSSLGVKAQRKSASGAGRRSHAGEGSLLMSAKKRARQSEYARRKSRAGTRSSTLGAAETSEADGMDVDG